MAKKTAKPATPKKSGASRKKASHPKKTASPKKSSAEVASQTVQFNPVQRFLLKRSQRVRHPVPLPSVWQLTKSAASIIWNNIWLFIFISVVYGIASLLLVQGLTNTTDASSVKSVFDHLSKGDFSSFFNGLGVYVVLIGSATKTSGPTSGPYQLILILMTSLALIWALRQILAGKKFRIRDTYYRGMYPIIPFFLVLLVVCIQFLPFIIGGDIYTTVVSTGIAAHAYEKLIWFLVFLGLAAWSLYMVSASVFALYIVTLPDLTPLQALRSARELVRHRRWTVLRKMLALPVILLVVAAVIMLPFILLLTAISQWIFFLLSMFALVPVHAYMYSLYREMIDDE